MRRKLLVAAGGAALVLGLSGAGVAVAASGDDEGGTVTGRQAEAATAAALKATHGGTANAVERDGEDGGTWEVEVTRSDGSTVDVRLDESYRVVGIEGEAGSAENESGSGEPDG